jgi:AcrR family transcriptional regulator
MDGSELPARPGRRRSEQSRQAILAAALHLVGESGYAGLTVEGIAAHAGTGKQTIYRWWPTRADVLMEALAGKADLHIPVPDEGSLVADLTAFLRATLAMQRVPQLAEVLCGLMAHAQVDPDFGRRFRDRFLQRRRDALGKVLGRARQRGELPPGRSVGGLTDLIFGTLWYRLLTGRPPDDALAAELVLACTTGPAGAPHRPGTLRSPRT